MARVIADSWYALIVLLSNASFLWEDVSYEVLEQSKSCSWTFIFTEWIPANVQHIAAEISVTKGRDTHS